MATKEKETPTGEKEQQGRGGGDRGSTAARPTLTRDWGGPQVRDPVPVVSVNPGADPPHPRAPIRPNWAEQGRGRKKRSRRGNGGDVDAGAADAEKHPRATPEAGERREGERSEGEGTKTAETLEEEKRRAPEEPVGVVVPA